MTVFIRSCLFKYLFPFAYVGIEYVVLISGAAFLLLDVLLWHLTKSKTESAQCNLWQGTDSHCRTPFVSHRLRWPIQQSVHCSNHNEVLGNSQSWHFCFLEDTFVFGLGSAYT